MKQYKKIAVYDFDGTLCDSPLPEEGKIIWKKVTGEEYPHQGWWGRLESLSTDVFDINLFPNVVSSLNNDMLSNDTYTIILTSRIERIKPAIEKILNDNNVKVDNIFLKRSGDEKDARLENIIKSLGLDSLESVDIYDDREKEFIAFERFMNNNPNLKVNIFKCNNGEIELYKNNYTNETISRLARIISEEIDNKISEELNNGKIKLK